MRIILTGMMGAGKTSTAKGLAIKMNYNYLDLDEILEEKYSMSIQDIFAQKGENFFRTIETDTLHHILQGKNSNIVLSLGGGTFIQDNNKELCLNHGLVIWLNTNLSILAQRLKGDKSRPILINNNDITQTLSTLFDDRKNHYNKAHITIDINNDILVSEISDILLHKIAVYQSK